VFVIVFSFSLFSHLMLSVAIDQLHVYGGIECKNYELFNHVFDHNFKIITIIIHILIICMYYNIYNYLIVKNYNICTYILKSQHFFLKPW